MLILNKIENTEENERTTWKEIIQSIDKIALNYYPMRKRGREKIWIEAKGGI